jgi:trehalose 6-phosphate phosphatase
MAAKNTFRCSARTDRIAPGKNSRKIMQQNWALFLDFDGTLIDIAPRPDAIVVPEHLPKMLQRLRDRLGGSLALVSGRTIGLLDKALAPVRFDAAGMHGLEIRRGDLEVLCTPEGRPVFRKAVHRLLEELGALPGVLIEDKIHTCAVHWRAAPQFHAQVIQALNDRLAELGGSYRLQLGKAVAEILPVESNKGEAIGAFMRHAPYLGKTPLFIGDDVTDEHGFEIVNALGGMSVHVGLGSTAAKRIVESPADVRERIARWTSGAPINPEMDFPDIDSAPATT